MRNPFPSKWLKADDLEGKTVRVTIRSCVMETIGDDNKPVMYFEGKDKGMVLNKTNWARMELGFRSIDSDDWTGKDILLYSEPVTFQGRTVNGLRVRIDQPAPPVEDDETIPF